MLSALCLCGKLQTVGGKSLDNRTINRSIALYAAAHNISIVRSFVDEGKTATSIRGRKCLQELLRAVESDTADYDRVLVYDVSRWGWFPDLDEAAHYEYLCKRAGITVHYCAEAV